MLVSRQSRSITTTAAPRPSRCVVTRATGSHGATSFPRQDAPHSDRASGRRVASKGSSWRGGTRQARLTSNDESAGKERHSGLRIRVRHGRSAAADAVGRARLACCQARSEAGMVLRECASREPSTQARRKAEHVVDVVVVQQHVAQQLARVQKVVHVCPEPMAEAPQRSSDQSVAESKSDAAHGVCFRADTLQRKWEDDSLHGERSRGKPRETRLAGATWRTDTRAGFCAGDGAVTKPLDAGG